MSWIDSHAHWAQEFPKGSDEAVMNRQIADLRAQGMLLSIQAGVDPEDWLRQRELAAKYPDWIRPVLGLHPWWVKDHSAEECEIALQLLKQQFEQHSDLIAGVGELGLDFSQGGKASEALQLRVFEWQLKLAQTYDKPLVLHLVHAHEQALEVLRGHANSKTRTGAQARSLRGIVHAFSGSLEAARQYLALGLKLSIGPGLSEPGRFLSLKRVLSQLAPTDWVLESDGAGERFFRTVQAASGLTGRTTAEIARQTFENLRETGLLGA